MDEKLILMYLLYIDELMFLVEHSAYRGFFTQLRISKSVETYEGFENVIILVGFLLLFHRILKCYL